MQDHLRSTLSSLTTEAMLTEAFCRLHPRLLAMIQRRVSNKLAVQIDPEGVVQEAYSRAQKRWPKLSPKPDNLDAWIFGQVIDQLIDGIRGVRAKKRNVDRILYGWDGSGAPLVDILVDSHTGPDTALSRDDRCKVVQAALVKLKPIECQILTMRYFEGLEFAEIGAILEIPANTANARALRALVKLRELIPRDFRPPGKSQP
jgi:RNA polymerase sigma-70 factor (ECF subfamily)